MENINEIANLPNNQIKKLIEAFNKPKKKENEAQLYAYGIKQWGVNYINYRI